ncbi:MAG: SPOR domain-containing protein [Flavobacteriales bacterium]|nr:SPOR domain-containing protein [Flavobacteriales bacterium]
MCTVAVATDDNDSIPQKKEPPVKEMFYGPTVGLGVGMLKFYGDVLDANYGNPLVSNIGYDLHVKQQLNAFLTAKFYVLFGTVSANERTAERNLNFRSALRVGGFALIYDFDHLLPKDRIINPFISLGIESVEFHSKTDLYDEYGNEYNYWSDGSIRNLPEDDPNASSAIIIQRDYFFETDLREMNVDGYGKYPERTFAIPIGAGAKMHMTENIDFTVGMTYHMTFSDLIDNVTGDSGGDRIGDHAGNGGKDKFLMTSFSVSYNFLKHKKDYDEDDGFDEDIDYLAYDTDDEDGDGVIDFIDECPWTPAGVEVDEKGCPLDKDGDFVPNYKDDELESREGAPVNRTGVEMTDDMIYDAYLHYIDSTGMFAETSTQKIVAGERSKQKKRYKVSVGQFTGAIDADLVDKFLSIPDVEIKTFGDTLTVIAVGDYDNLPEAVKRKIELTEQGFDAAIVVEQAKDGTFKSVGDAANNMDVNDVADHPFTDEIVFRVQLGAFSKRLTQKELKGLQNVMEIKGSDGLYKYLYSQSFKTVEEAAGKKIDLAVDYGVKDAFVVAYQGGKRIRLKDAGVNTTATENITPASEKTYDKEKIRFKIQIGSYKNQLPTEVLSKFMELEDVDQTTKDGLTRYTAGEFTSYEEAEAYKAKVIEAGIGGAFVIATHEEELLPVAKAREIIGE